MQIKSSQVCTQKAPRRNGQFKIKQFLARWSICISGCFNRVVSKTKDLVIKM